MAPVIVQNAQLAPGTCFLSGDFNGPFIDTGKSIRGVGRIYLSVKHLGSFMREAGWVPTSEVEGLLAEVEEFDRVVGEYREDAESYRQIVEALAPLLPQPEPIVREVGIVKDGKVRAANVRLLGALDEANHELGALRAEVDELAAQVEAASQPAAGDDPQGEGSTPDVTSPAAPNPSDDEPPSVVVVAEQEVNLDELLDRNVEDVVSVAAEWPEDARALVVARDAFRRQAEGKDPRKTLANGLFPAEV